jgi:hypothetical protein
MGTIACSIGSLPSPLPLNLHYRYSFFVGDCSVQEDDESVAMLFYARRGIMGRANLLPLLNHVSDTVPDSGCNRLAHT